MPVKMRSEVKQKWLAALRSGKYKQGKHNLRNERNEYCCLGVLCDVARKEGVIPNPIRSLNDPVFLYGKGGREDRSGGTLPYEVIQWAGLDYNHTPSNPVIGSSTAAHWNDGANKTFEEIADLIEEYL